MQVPNPPMELPAMRACWHQRPPARTSTRALIEPHLLALQRVRNWGSLKTICMSLEGSLLGVPRDLVKLEESLRTEGSVDMFAPLERGGLRESPSASALSEHLRRVGFLEPERTMRLCLQALTVKHEEMTGHSVSAELVATLPPEMPGIARTTDQGPHGNAAPACAGGDLTGLRAN